jgi:hypothetical protein
MVLMQDLVGAQEVADVLGVTRQRVHQLTQIKGFPEPVARLTQGSVWKLRHIEKWQKRNRPINEVASRKDLKPPARDPERPQDDPWDANVVRFLLATPEGGTWRRGDLMECLREQPNRVERQPGRVAEAKRLAAKHGVERRPDPGGKTIHFFRTDAQAPTPYPNSATERRSWLAKDR